MHPACSALIFTLPAFPYPATSETETKSPVYGVDHRLVLDGCRIITNCFAAEKGDHYLSKDRAGRNPVPPPSDDVLPPGKYFYHPAPPTYTTRTNYRIVTDFTAWRFPERIPDHWKRPMASPEEYADLQRKYMRSSKLDMRDAVIRGDGGCVVTKYVPVNSCHVHHIVPRVHKDWFFGNHMEQYSWADMNTNVDDPANGITLRADLGECFDSHGWVFYPDGQGRLMTYVCLPYVDFAELLHRRLVTLSRRVSDEFLYARFAHTMVKLVNTTSVGFKRFHNPEGARPAREEAALRTETLHDDDQLIQTTQSEVESPWLEWINEDKDIL